MIAHKRYITESKVQVVSQSFFTSATAVGVDQKIAFTHRNANSAKHDIVLNNANIMAGGSSKERGRSALIPTELFIIAKQEFTCV